LISYIPQREQGDIVEGVSGGLRRIVGAKDKGDYYFFENKEFKTLKDATNYCMWK